MAQDRNGAGLANLEYKDSDLPDVAGERLFGRLKTGPTGGRREGPPT
jgi:hypothetical protein